MAKGGFPRGGMMGGGMMRQQAQMQQKLMKMQKAQKEVEESVFTASVGGGTVKVSCNGKKELTELVIAPEAVDPGEVEMLQDMVLSAANEALRQAEEAMNKAVSGASGGLNLGF